MFPDEKHKLISAEILVRRRHSMAAPIVFDIEMQEPGVYMYISESRGTCASVNPSLVFDYDTGQ